MKHSYYAQEIYYLKAPFFSRKKVVGVQPPFNDRRVGGKHNTVKQADSGLGGWMLRKFHGEALKPDHILAFCQASFRMTLSRAGFRMLAPGILACWMIFLCTCSSVSSVNSVLSGYSFTGIPQNFWFANSAHPPSFPSFIFSMLVEVDL